MINTFEGQQLYISDSKVHGANMGPIWGRQDSGGPHDGPMNFAMWDLISFEANGIRLIVTKITLQAIVFHTINSVIVGKFDVNKITHAHYIIANIVLVTRHFRATKEIWFAIIVWR